MVYLDNNATTRVIEEAAEAMLRYSTELYVNASSSAAEVTGADLPRRDAAAAIARLLSVEDTDSFTFTSSASESNNWVLGPIVSTLTGRTIVISAIEHPSISEPAEALRAHGFQVRVASVDSNGSLDLDALASLLTPEVGMVSIMAANNETGVLQPIPQIGEIIRDRCPAALFHTDASQAVGKIPIDLDGPWQEIDLLSFSGHKLHGPKGIGGLFARAGLDLPPLLVGGSQEQGRRAGTLNTPALAALAVAAEFARKADMGRVADLRDGFEIELLNWFPQALIHSKATQRLPNTSCFSVPGIVANDMAEMLAQQGIIVGTGSACSSGSLRPPSTLLAMGVPYEIASSALRLSLSKFSTVQDLEGFIGIFGKIHRASEELGYASGARK